MSSNSERSFGQRYTLGRGLAKYLELIPAYAPPDPDLLPANLDTFLDTVNIANNEATAAEDVLQTARDIRFKMYKQTGTGIIAQCALMRDYVGSMVPNGKKKLNYKKLQKRVMLMRGIRLRKKPPVNGDPKKSNSVSEQSFGSICRVAKDVLEVIKGIPGYAPSNPALTVATYTVTVADADEKNNEVAQLLDISDNKKEVRFDLYTQLDDRTRRIKGALAAQFGKTSNEYKDALKY